MVTLQNLLMCTQSYRQGAWQLKHRASLSRKCLWSCLLLQVKSCLCAFHGHCGTLTAAILPLRLHRQWAEIVVVSSDPLPVHVYDAASFYRYRATRHWQSLCCNDHPLASTYQLSSSSNHDTKALRPLHVSSQGCPCIRCWLMMCMGVTAVATLTATATLRIF